MANLSKYPIRPGDNAAECPGINDELWERQWLACEKLERNYGLVYRVRSGYRDPQKQEVLYGCYQERLRTGRCPQRCCGGTCCNLAAVPGTSKHEKGLAIDFTNNPRNNREATNVFYEYGIIFPIWGVQPEPWHGELDPNRKPLQGQSYVPTTPGVKIMSLRSAHTINGITLQANLFLDEVQIRWNHPQAANWTANGYARLADMGDGAGRVVGKVPKWGEEVIVGEIPDGAGPRFCVVVFCGGGIQYTAFQKQGTTGPPWKWECTSGGPSKGWF